MNSMVASGLGEGKDPLNREDTISLPFILGFEFYFKNINISCFHAISN